MMVNGIPYRTIWPTGNGGSVQIIDQTRLPHEFVTISLKSVKDTAEAISNMRVRGAPLIGATAAYGLALALSHDESTSSLDAAYELLLATRPTAINLRWALDRVRAAVTEAGISDRAQVAYRTAALICDEDVANCRAIGEHGVELIRACHRRDRDPVNILTHCNAGWLAAVDWGTALAPIYVAHEEGIPVHVWVDETRPRNQGASLTAWELGQNGIPHTLIADNAGGHLMQHGMIDLCITGSDRTTTRGDVCNKIGTYLKALAAKDNGVPFYVALPQSTIDWSIADGVAEIPIELRDPSEITHVTGKSRAGYIVSVAIAPENCNAANYAFDVTPANLVSGLITEQGICQASTEGLLSLYPKQNGYALA